MPVKGKTPSFLHRAESFYLDRPIFGSGISLWMNSDAVPGTNMHTTTYLQWYIAEFKKRRRINRNDY